MEDTFAEVYRRMIARVEPDPARLRRGLQALAQLTAEGPPPSGNPTLQSAQKCGIPGSGEPHPSKHGKAGNGK